MLLCRVDRKLPYQLKYNLFYCKIKDLNAELNQATVVSLLNDIPGNNPQLFGKGTL